MSPFETGATVQACCGSYVGGCGGSKKCNLARLLRAAKAVEDAMAPIQFNVPERVTKAVTALRAEIARVEGF